MKNNDFNLDDYVDAVTGRPASEVISEGGPGHYQLEQPGPPPMGVLPQPDRGSARSQTLAEEGVDKPPASDMLRDLMTQKHDPTRQSVTIPVKELMAVIVEIGNIERKAQANGQLCMEKTRELVQLRAELSACQQSREEKIDTISRVWTLLETESPFGEDLRAEDVRIALSTRPEVNAKSVLGETFEPDADIPETKEPKDK